MNDMELPGMWSESDFTGGPEPACYLRYKRDLPEGMKFSAIRYPWKQNVSRERAEKMLASMPDPSKFEIVEVT